MVGRHPDPEDAGGPAGRRRPERRLSAAARGTVYLVGAGPGDPGLLTVRAAELLERAEAVVHDVRIDAGEVAERAPAAEVVTLPAAGPTGVVAGRLIELAAADRTVIWLVPGDPFLSGEVQDLVDALLAAGVSLALVPGVPTAVAAATHAGLRRGPGGEVCLGGGPGGSAPEPEDGPPVRLIEARASGVPAIAERLLRAGASAATPAGVIVRGGSPRQRVLASELGALAEAVAELPPDQAVVLSVGPAAARGERLTWFEDRPLFGCRVVVTRPSAQAGGFVAELEALGAEVIRFPTIRIQPADDPAPLREAARSVGGYRWVVFTSANGVERFGAALDEVGLDARALAGVSVCAIGPATAQALRTLGVRADLVPERFVAEAVLEALAARTPDLRGARVLLPRADLARALLPEELRARGAEVTEVVAYRTVPDTSEAEGLERRIRDGEVDVVTFTSSSTVQNFVRLLGSEIGSAEVASIGPVTSATARGLGLPVHTEAREFTVAGLIDAIIERRRARGA